jgi:hypothetical protein
MYRLALCLVFLSTLPLAADTVRIPPRRGAVLELSGDGFSSDRKLRLSGELTLTCLVEGEAASNVSSVTIEPDGKLWEVIGRSQDSRDNYRSHRITLAPAQPGSIPLPLVLLRFRDGTSVRWENEIVEVIGPPPSQAGTIRGDMKPESLPELAPAHDFPVLWLILGAAGGGLIVTGLFMIRRPRVEVTLTPRERSLRDLEQLRGSPHPHERLARILRAHAEDCLGIPATRQTTEEVMTAAAQQTEITEDLRLDLEKLLAECDRVNFAGAACDAAEIEHLLASARDWVERSSPAAAADSGR